MSGCGDTPGQADSRPISVEEKVNAKLTFFCFEQVCIVIINILSNQNSTADSFIRPCIFKMDEKGKEEMM